jgi:hypothetical protein
MKLDTWLEVRDTFNSLFNDRTPPSDCAFHPSITDIANNYSVNLLNASFPPGTFSNALLSSKGLQLNGILQKV